MFNKIFDVFFSFFLFFDKEIKESVDKDIELV